MRCQMLVFLLLVVNQLWAQNTLASDTTFSTTAQSNKAADVTIGDTAASHLYISFKDAPPGRDPATARSVARQGTITYVTALIFDYAIALPLRIAAANRNKVELGVLASATDLVITATKIAGPIKNGVGASIAHENVVRSNVAYNKKFSWGFYGIGWLFSATSLATSVISGVYSMADQEIDGETAAKLLTVGVSARIVADALWLVSVIHGSNYTKKVLGMTRQSSLTVFPMYYARTQSLGAGMRLSF